MSDNQKTEEVVKVTIFGEEYSIRGYADTEYILRVADYVDKKMREIALRSKNRAPHKIAVLTALNLADELQAAILRVEQVGDFGGHAAGTYGL